MLKTNLQEPIEKHWEVLSKERGNSLIGMLQCLYELRFTCKIELDEIKIKHALGCLGTISEDTGYKKEVRAFCYKELGDIFSKRSNFIKI